MNVTCSSNSECCTILSSKCVFYESSALPYTGINTNDSLQVALQKIEAAFAMTSSGVVVAIQAGAGISIGGTAQVPIITNTLTGAFWPLAGPATLTSAVVIDGDSNDLTFTNLNAFVVQDNIGASMTMSSGSMVVTGGGSPQPIITAGSSQVSLAVGTSQVLVSSTQLDFRTNAASRLIIENDGSWNVGGSNGTAGFVLTSNGAALPPTWQASASGGITNSAPNTALMMSDGTNAINSGLFLTGTILTGLGSLNGTLKIASGGGTPTRRLDVEENSTSTNIVLYPVRLIAVSQNTPANGIGTGLEFVTETSNGNNEIGATIEAITTDVTAASEDFDLVFKTMNAGATAAEVLRLSSTILTIGGGLSSTSRSIIAGGTGADVGLGIASKGNGALSFATTNGTDGDITLNAAVGIILLRNSTNATATGEGTVIRTTSSSSITNIIEVFDNSRSSVSTAVKVRHNVNSGAGSPLLGVGTSIDFETHTAASNYEIGSSIQSVSTDITGGSEDFDLVFKTMAAGAAATEKVRITSDGRLYGTALHNNAGAITGTANQYIASGTYVPTLTGILNVDSATVGVFQFMRVGNVVHVSGSLSVDTTSSATTTQVDISLPVASDLTNQGHCVGAGAAGVTLFGYINGETTNNRASYIFTSTGTGALTHLVHFTYLIL